MPSAARHVLLLPFGGGPASFSIFSSRRAAMPAIAVHE
jgi:hypothetical protein